MNTNKILVPTDFSKVADCAVDHAVKLASLSNGQVVLLNVVAKDSEHNDAKLKLEGKSKGIFEKYNVKVEYIIRTGNIFEDIGAVASEIKASLIIMGTHGAKGFQKITGSYALKVITNSEVPFVVVQERAIGANGYKKIVLPINFSRETKHKLKQTIQLAKYFDSEVDIIYPNETDELLAKNLKNNIAYTEATLKSEGIRYKLSASIGGDFTKQVLKFAIAEKADLIAIVNEQKSTFMSLSDEQDIIANDAQIPALCVNPAQVTVKGGILGS